jgi:outer membrane protein assembly factor BamA
LGGREGEFFSADKWRLGLQKLYNTQVLYDVQTAIEPHKESKTIAITITLRDKWTILPDLSISTGGGAGNFGIGIVDINLFGTFTRGNFNFSSYNGVSSYEVKLFQEWFLDTDYMFGVDIVRSGTPLSVLNSAGVVQESLVWVRDQQTLTLGRRFGSSVRLLVDFTHFIDLRLQNQGADLGIIPAGHQYSVLPKLILGRAHRSNYLEHGYELTLAPAFSNFLGGETPYSSGVASFKGVFILSERDNLGFLLSGGIQHPLTPAYQFHLGGLDSVRGFSNNRVLGNYYWSANVEYRPLIWVTRSSFFDIDMVAFQGCLFSDVGQMGGGVTGNMFLASVGAGLRVNFVKFAGAILRFDFAKTLAPDEGTGFSFGLGQFF